MKAKPVSKQARGPRAARPKADKLQWEGVTLAVAYEPRWLESETAHLEVRVQAPKGAPLPITETGYRSHFLPCGAVEDAGGPITFVRAWLDEAAKSAAWRRVRNRWRQLDLFA